MLSINTSGVHDPYDQVCGDTWQISGPLLDSAGNPLNLTGAAISWRLDSLDGAANYLAVALGSGIAITSLPTATIRVSVPASRTAALAPGNYRDCLRVTLADGSVFTEWTGIIRAAPSPA